IERLKAVFGGRRLRQIDELSIERHKRARAATAPVAVNRELAVLKSLFNRCRDDLRIYDGPTPRIKLLKESGGRVRFLDAAERRQRSSRWPRSPFARSSWWGSTRGCGSSRRR